MKVVSAKTFNRFDCLLSKQVLRLLVGGLISVVSVSTSGSIVALSANAVEVEAPKPDLGVVEQQPVEPVKLEEITDLDVSQLVSIDISDPNLLEGESVVDAAEAAPFAQVTSVSQLSDVSPTDWAFQALQSLVERYGCIAGYPDATYRGNRALSRYEFAAGLNACMDRINELVTAGTENLVVQADLDVLRRLQAEFASELSVLRGRVDTLEAKTATLEGQQFSTTTKLTGEAIFAIAASNHKETLSPQTSFGEEATFSERIRLDLDTSFTGKDLLRATLLTGNVQGNSGMAFLNYGGYSDNQFALRDLWYTFPAGDRLRFMIGASDTSFDDFAELYSPYFAYVGSGALTFFGAYNYAVYPFSADQLLAGNLQLSETISIDFGYFTYQPNLPTAKNGLFNGDFGTSIQLNLKPSSSWNLGLIYTYTFQPGKDVTLVDTVGSATADNPFQTATAAHRFGVMTNWNVTPKINVGGWVGYINAEAKAGVREGDNADILTWAATLALLDVGNPGSILGLVVGMPPKATRVEGGLADPDTSLFLEASYRYRLTDNILITPGVFAIINPDHDRRNSDIWAGILRTTFSF
jgi:hypothetical protein